MTPENSFAEEEQQKVLIAGWFSFEHGHATGGDILALEVTREWLRDAGYVNCDIAFDPPFAGGVNWRTVDAKAYSHVIFVCGPFEQKIYEAEFLAHFSSCRLVGLNLSIPAHLSEWNPFDLLYERNSTKAVRPDMVFLSKRAKVPVVGVCLVEPYPGGLDREANEAIQRLVDSREVAVVYIDTRLDVNGTHLRTPAEIESLIARVDVLLTTRLHGAVMAIKNGVPVVPIDPEAGGAKIVDQMKRIGWPFVFTADALNDEALTKAFDYCFTEEARTKAQACRLFAIETLEETRKDFISQLNSNGSLEENFLLRTKKNKRPAWAETLLKEAAQTETASKKNKAKSLAKKAVLLLLPGIVFYAAKRMRRR
ncbi:polysaccharide pyruvyl transferase family protein [Flavisolibacter ginsenosidimutans]|uniref:Polysaccharide pyruvyl transferase family protein n=1 Tax=Flavisolibacter ginsenosidimutans TaxID=661481 RepID=A0A5B8UFD0_9BACT|nr:polysaccharide pyruvyl transferase family protein [Flavisolibacter ginsenosidimutans]QEC55208.1 polysaccharide pyruvyl transferase family protein [Flavisolibacter ginsenosidimutans]